MTVLPGSTPRALITPGYPSLSSHAPYYCCCRSPEGGKGKASPAFLGQGKKNYPSPPSPSFFFPPVLFTHFPSRQRLNCWFCFCMLWYGSHDGKRHGASSDIPKKKKRAVADAQIIGLPHLIPTSRDKRWENIESERGREEKEKESQQVLPKPAACYCEQKTSAGRGVSRIVP